ncbi:isatin hydrolase-like [Metopolophium dirhodum]|uniref:isatin hydrolase-like n=1 Tax=Metopolophium dirhodum TaxID=44670 RepID=UPI00299079AA|nr:isatin hydrolase-like [Metopolophium dirhodum]XP_060876536.1 isatin hydrolase-like [Metopolophium dirhodum]XP_060876537.1 isatin hydrolase-like [Metopolophium dirhodum]
MECSRLRLLSSSVGLAVVAMTALLPYDTTAALIDLCHGYRYGVTTCWDPTQRFDIFDVHTGSGPNGVYTTESFSTPEHCGTHLDSPFHFNPVGWKLEDIPLDRMVVEGVHVNVSSEVNGNGDFLLTVGHLKAWEQAHGPLPNRSVILVNFGWAHKFGNRQSYFNGLREPYRFPGLSRDAAQWIVDSGKVYGVGVDGPSVDPGRSTTYGVHGVLSKANLYNLENVALNGTTLPPRGFKLVVQPVKIVGGTGGPVRILAFTNDPFKLL